MNLVYVANNFGDSMPFIVDRLNLLSRPYEKTLVVSNFVDTYLVIENIELITVPIKNYLPQGIISINGLMQSSKYKRAIDQICSLKGGVHLVFATWGDFNFGLIYRLKKRNFHPNLVITMLIGNYSKRTLTKGGLSLNKALLMSQLKYSNEVIYFDPNIALLLTKNGVGHHTQFLFGSRIGTTKPLKTFPVHSKEIIWVGRKVMEKGVKTLIHAVDEHKEYNFRAIGSGKVGIQRENFVDTPRMHREELDDVMAKSFILLFTSCEEGLPNVVLDAMAIGLPVLTTSAGGLKNVLIHKQNSYIHGGDPSSIREGIRWLSVPENWLVVSKNGQKLISSDLNYDKAIKNWKVRYL